LATVTSSSVGILGTGQTTSFGEETLVRTRGLFDIFLTSSSSAGDGYFGAVGIGLVTLAAFTAGAASVPTPVTEDGWDGWLWHQYVSVHEDSPDGQGDGGGHHRVEIDAKAMRKVQGEMVLYAAFEFTEIGTAVANIFLNSRMLSKLP